MFSVAIDPESSSLVASGGEDDKAYLWKIADGEVAFECKGGIGYFVPKPVIVRSKKKGNEGWTSSSASFFFSGIAV